MSRRILHAAGIVAAGLLVLHTRSFAAEDRRTFDLDWSVNVDQIPGGAAQAVLWIAVPQELPEQHVTSIDIDSDAPWTFVEDPTFHNKGAQVVFANPPGSLAVGVHAHVVRKAVEKPRPAKLTSEERALYLRSEALVSLSPGIRALADSIGGTSRTRYDYVLASMDYDKTVPGWGNGDSERACKVGKGNCTDFHSLFMSLSRAEGIPAVFEMGYSTLPEGERNHTGGYHCWAWFYDDTSAAWVPVDISEADKHPDKAEFFFGHLDADRITFSRGRDVRLPGMQGKPLNYLPAGAYVEVDGKPFATVRRTLSYSVDGTTSAARH